MDVQEIKLTDIQSDADFNCRGVVTPNDVIDLACSIEEVGLQQPIVVMPIVSPKYKYKIVMGHRRYQAFKNLKRETIPCSIRDNLTLSQASVLNIVENLQRKNLTFLQECKGIKTLYAKHLTIKQIAQLIKMSSSFVSIRLDALKLPEDIQVELDTGILKACDVPRLLRIPSLEQKYAAVREIKDASMRGERKRVKIAEEQVVDREFKKSEKKLRTVTEIFVLQDKIHAILGPCVATMALGYCCGFVSENDVMEAVRALAREVAA